MKLTFPTSQSQNESDGGRNNGSALPCNWFVKLVNNYYSITTTKTDQPTVTDFKNKWLRHSSLEIPHDFGLSLYRTSQRCIRGAVRVIKALEMCVGGSCRQRSVDVCVVLGVCVCVCVCVFYLRAPGAGALKRAVRVLGDVWGRSRLPLVVLDGRPIRRRLRYSAWTGLWLCRTLMASSTGNHSRFRPTGQILPQHEQHTLQRLYILQIMNRYIVGS